MSKKRKVAISSILIIAALGLFFLKGGVDWRALVLLQEAPRVGSLAPDFELTRLDGRIVRLAGFRGTTPIFLNFWASWCPACRKEASQTKQLFRDFGPKGLEFLAISVDQGPAAVDQVRKFTEEFELGFVSLLDPQHDVLDRYGVTAISTIFLIDRDGVIVAKEVGPRNWSGSQWLERLEQLLK